MARLLHSQEIGIDHSESLVVDALSVNGRDEQAEYRAHMRELTMARQAAERRFSRPLAELRLDRGAREEAVRERETALQAELARIDAEHLAWLRAHRLADLPERVTRMRLPPDSMTSA